MKRCYQDCPLAEAAYKMGFERGYQAAEEVLSTLKGIEFRGSGNFNTLVDEAIKTLKTLRREVEKNTPMCK